MPHKINKQNLWTQGAAAWTLERVRWILACNRGSRVSSWLRFPAWTWKFAILAINDWTDWFIQIYINNYPPSQHTEGGRVHLRRWRYFIIFTKFRSFKVLELYFKYIPPEDPWRCDSFGTSKSSKVPVIVMEEASGGFLFDNTTSSQHLAIPYLLPWTQKTNLLHPDGDPDAAAPIVL